MTVRATSWRQIGTNVDVVVSGLDLEPVAAVVRNTISDADAAFSRFRNDSELARVNRAEGRPVRVSELFASAAEIALRAARATDGLVDPSVGSAVRALGYDRDFELVGSSGASTGAPITFVKVPGWRVVELNRDARTLRVPRGVELDLDSIGKAFIVDLALAGLAPLLAADGGVLLSIGGDMAVAGRPPRGGWRVQLAEDSALPSRTDAPVAIIRNGALATSSTTVRRWRRGTAIVHHLVDPRTGRPSDGPWRTATVVANDCVGANTAATCAIVLGDGAPAWLSANGFPARLVANDGSLTYAGGWPADVPATTSAAA